MKVDGIGSPTNRDCQENPAKALHRCPPFQTNPYVCIKHALNFPRFVKQTSCLGRKVATTCDQLPHAFFTKQFHSQKLELVFYYPTSLANLTWNSSPQTSHCSQELRSDIINMQLSKAKIELPEAEQQLIEERAH